MSIVVSIVTVEIATSSMSIHCIFGFPFAVDLILPYFFSVSKIIDFIHGLDSSKFSSLLPRWRSHYCYFFRDLFILISSSGLSYCSKYLLFDKTCIKSPSSSRCYSTCSCHNPSISKKFNFFTVPSKMLVECCHNCLIRMAKRSCLYKFVNK